MTQVKEAKYTKVVEIDLSTIKPSISGPKRPQDLILLSDAKQEFQDAVVREAGVRGFGLDKKELEKRQKLILRIIQKQFKWGMWPLQLITSCTNTSNPYVLMAAGLLAKKQLRKG